MADACVLQLIESNNKPFAVQGVVDNLQTQGIKKAAAQKALDALVDKGRIVVKEFGKVKIYLPSQAGKEVLSKEELDARRAEAGQQQQLLQQELAAVRELEAGLQAWTSSLTAEELAAKVQQLQTQTAANAAKLEQLSSGAVLVTEEQRLASERSFVAAMDAWRKRRGVFRAIWDAISEGLDGKQADLYEEIGVDTDEATGISYKELEVLLPRAGAKRAK